MLNTKYYSSSPDSMLEKDLAEMYFLFFILVCWLLGVTKCNSNISSWEKEHPRLLINETIGLQG